MQHVGLVPARTRYGRCRVRSLLPLVLSDQAHHALASWIFVSRPTADAAPDISPAAAVGVRCSCTQALLRACAPLIARALASWLSRIDISVPAQRPARLVLDDARLEEVLFLLEI